MPTKNVRKHTAIKTERPPEPISKRFIVDTDGYKRIIRKHKPNEPPYSNSYVAATIEADLFSAYHSLCHAVETLKDSGLDRVYVDGNSPFSHTEAILRYSLILGYHMQGNANNPHFKKYLSKINPIKDWNGMFPIKCIEMAEIHVAVYAFAFYSRYAPAPLLAYGMGWLAGPLFP